MAQLTGTARRHARWGALTQAEQASGVAELREIAGHRADLLAEVAGLALGTAESKGPEYLAQGHAAAELCRLAGADESLIPQWIRREGAGPQPRGSRRSVGQAALRGPAAGRTDLLAEIAGLLEGFAEGALKEPIARKAVGLCREAGADLDGIPRGSRSAMNGRRPGCCRRFPVACMAGEHGSLDLSTAFAQVVSHLGEMTA